VKERGNQPLGSTETKLVQIVGVFLFCKVAVSKEIRRSTQKTMDHPEYKMPKGSSLKKVGRKKIIEE